MTVEQYRKTTDLPSTIPVFPLTGALLFPRWSLPLNIFEPRYLNMIDDAMTGNRLIGMVQSTGGHAATPELADVGCVGRLTSYSETDDGRYLISLTGICRFRIEEELSVKTPYRQVHADWSRYAFDLQPDPGSDEDDRIRLTNSLKRYTNANKMEVDWDAVENASMETLINALSAGCPFGAIEKQALLEADTVSARTETLITLLDMDVPGDDTSTLQ
ncbi:MAG: LON peptidase substrate-binding domain-containing protein [Pseudomonadota bacterium]